MKTYKTAYYFRLLIVMCTYTAFIIRMIVTYKIGSADGNIGNAYLDMVSYFTIQSNLIVAIYFTLTIFYMYKLKTITLFSPIIKGSMTLYMIITSLIYLIFLLPLYPPHGLYAVSAYLFHTFIPVLVVLDWVIYEGNRYTYKYLCLWLIYPFIYLLFILLRGKISLEYPYPFVNVIQLGLKKVLWNSFWMASFILLLGALLIFINQRKLRSNHNK